MFLSLPLTLAPLLVYNLVIAGFFGATPGDPWVQPVFTVTMVSDARFTLLLGDVLIVAALACLFVEIVKATRTAGPTIVDHVLSFAVFVVHLVEFLTVGAAATSVFFILTVVATIDVIGGFTITIRGARRDFGIDRD
ncbi:hypothetical protein EYW49_14500 [Siculibacillus lacustris]|uniref:Transmembrane protein n=1 Tax=Siculibacillus lacustris TaxID=1549641 RepID=A0A4Q9VLN7_9HYPH|nr:hypothetical protein [Siculibacillus lacustris]TBW36311.1 hypothetical protein EYW49_14500 [Siculibacillus lacustris]